MLSECESIPYYLIVFDSRSRERRILVFEISMTDQCSVVKQAKNFSLLHRRLSSLTSAKLVSQVHNFQRTQEMGGSFLFSHETLYGEYRGQGTALGFMASAKPQSLYMRVFVPSLEKTIAAIFGIRSANNTDNG
jgi:hypothetical protein